MRLTNDGKNLLLRAQNGTTLKFKRVGIGDGKLPEETEIKDLSDLVSEKMSVKITNYDLDEEKNLMKFEVVFTNENLVDSFFIREAGIFAEDPDDPNNEILYCAFNVGDEADFMPNDSDVIPTKMIYQFYTSVGEAENIKVILNDSVIYVTREEYQSVVPEMKKKVEQLVETEISQKEINENVSQKIKENEEYKAALTETLESISEYQSDNDEEINKIKDALGNDLDFSQTITDNIDKEHRKVISLRRKLRMGVRL
jgi:hypothetical protein